MNKKYTTSKKKYIVNERIRVSKLLVIDEKGEKLGVLSKDEALSKAKDLGLDLVLVSNDFKNPVGKITDLGKMLYDEKKKLKESKKNATKEKIKEIRVMPTIGDHDLNVRISHAKKWLSSGYKIKFVIKVFGRFNKKLDFVNILFTKFLDAIKMYGVPLNDGKINIAGAFRHIIIIPKKNNSKGDENEK